MNFWILLPFKDKSFDKDFYSVDGKELEQHRLRVY